VTSAKRFFIIDAMAMAFRNYHAFGARPLTTSGGLPVSAVYGSAVFLMKLIEDENPDYLAIATDSREPTFRHELYPAYKSNRTEMPEDLAAQLPSLFRLFESFGIPILKQPGMEADDLIGTLVKRFSGKTTHCFIVSGDKDFLQLVNPYVSLYSPKKGGEVNIVNADGVFAKFGCRPEQVIDVLALIGDTSDHVPGVPGIGEKGAAKLIASYGSLENLYNNINDLTNQRYKDGLANNKDQAFVSKKLVTIHCDIELQQDLHDFSFSRDHCFTRPELLEFVRELEFGALERKLRTKANAIPRSSTTLQAATTDFPWRLLTDQAQRTEVIQSLSSAPCLAFDTETSGLDPVSDFPIGVSLSWSEKDAVYIPMPDKESPDYEGVTKDIRTILSNQKQLKLAHNLKFDTQMLSNVGIHPSPPFADSMIESYLLEPGAKSHGLDGCAERHLRHKMIPISELIGTDKNKSMRDVDVALVAKYSCEDAWATLRLHQHFQPALKEKQLERLYHEVEMPLVPVLARMERRGIYVDAEVLSDISEELCEKMSELQKSIFALVGREFNLNSTKQLQQILFEEMKIHETLNIKRIKKTKAGFSTDSSVLEMLSEHPLPKAMLDYRQLSKLKNTYVDTLPQLIHPNTLRIHTSFHQTGTATGRLSSSDPNLQNIPIRSTMGRSIRKAFRAQSAEWCMISADYSQIELRLLAHLADEQALIDAFASGQDIHRATASKIFGLNPEDVDSTLRSRAKAINFGIIYGMGPQRLARETGVTIAEAKSFITKYFDGFPRIRDYIDSSIDFARSNGYTLTMTGRRRPMPEINSDNPGTRVNAENMAVNSPVQGSAADLIKLAMIAIDEKLQSIPDKAYMVLQVHDELVFECKKQYSEEITQMIRAEMESAFALKVPLLVEVGVGDNWLDAHS
jgi:DNA polymerase I